MTESKHQSLKGTVIGAALLFFVDAFIINQGIFAGLVGLISIFIGLLSLILSKDKALGLCKFKRGLVWFIAAVMVFICNQANNKIARHRADRLIFVIQNYKNKTGKYPQELNNLVPNYIPRIPHAKYTFGMNSFTYFCSHEDPFLYYVAIPPFGRPTYRFSKKAWSFLD